MTTAPTNGLSGNPPLEIEDRVLKVIALTKRLPREAVTLDSSFESLGIDSLDRLNILFDLESEFDIQINDEDAKRVENIPQMIAGVQALVDAKSGDTPAAPSPSASTPAPSPVTATATTASSDREPAAGSLLDTTKSSSSLD